MAFTSFYGLCPCDACQHGGLRRVRMTATGPRKTTLRNDRDRHLARMQRRNSRGRRQRAGHRA
jgi:hypothetical protein